MSKSTEVAILSRIIEPTEANLPGELARQILQWRFSEQDKLRMQELLVKAKKGVLTKSEKEEAEHYERIGHFLSILKSKARASMTKRSQVS